VLAAAKRDERRGAGLESVADGGRVDVEPGGQVALKNSPLVFWHFGVTLAGLLHELESLLVAKRPNGLVNLSAACVVVHPLER
jgi:hypothetical protein